MLIHGNLEINGGALNVEVDPYLTSPTPTLFINDNFDVVGNVTGTGANINFNLGENLPLAHADDFDQREFTVVTATGNVNLQTQSDDQYSSHHTSGYCCRPKHTDNAPASSNCPVPGARLQLHLLHAGVFQGIW